MADFPVTNTSNSESIKSTTSISSQVTPQAQITAENQLPEQVKIPSQVLSKTPNKIVFSLPNQPPLRIDTSNNDALNNAINIGDKVNLTLIKDASTVVVTITPTPPKPSVLLEVPLSESFRKTLSQETSLPNNESLIKSHLDKNSTLYIGQARRLPQEQITLKVNDSTAIKTPLPNVTSLPLNQTLQTNLVLNNQQQIMVQFSKLPVEMPSYQVALPLTQLTSTVSPATLAALPISHVNNIDEVMTQIIPASAQQTKVPDIDMTKPLNQLWLRHQISPQLFSQLSTNIEELSAKGDSSIRAEISLNVKNSEALGRPVHSNAVDTSAAIKQPTSTDVASAQKQDSTLAKSLSNASTGDDSTQTKTTNEPAQLAAKESLPLQKLNELIGLLKTQKPADQAPLKVNPIDSSSLPSSLKFDTTAAKSDSSIGAPSNDNLVAINQLKTLSKQVATQLPAMPQLTNPAQLSYLFEQFTRFEPLSAVNLNSLGPLANALQLMLGGRHAAQGNMLSPELLNHLKKIMKKTTNSSGSNDNLTTALTMLGNLKSLKPLEESLTSLSSHIQFYQYQNAEQQQSNQPLFYFNIPTKEPHLPQVEGEVEQQHNGDGHGNKSWRLTLLLPCGGDDKIKVNALLTGSSLELDLTSNSELIVQKVDFYKGFLANRLESLGFDEATVSCQQGDIPKTLLKRPNQLVELMI